MDILIVDDSEVTRTTLCRLLQARGHAVRTAACTPGATKMLMERPADAVLLDQVLPGDDAKALAAFILREIKLCKTRVLICTGLPGDEPLSWPGVNGLLHKPFEVEDVERALGGDCGE